MISHSLGSLSAELGSPCRYLSLNFIKFPAFPAIFPCYRAGLEGTLLQLSLYEAVLQLQFPHLAQPLIRGDFLSWSSEDIEFGVCLDSA